jgi:S1-C subfamily serine protease
MARRKIFGLAFILILVSPASPVVGQILRYQDAEGLWHFADRPGDGAFPIAETGPAPAPALDLEAQLTHGQGGGSDPDLAVVLIRTALSEGAGFFCTPDGYILTTRHVVRPVGSDAWRQGQATVDQDKGGLEELEGKLREWRSRLGRMTASQPAAEDEDRSRRVQVHGAEEAEHADAADAGVSVQAEGEVGRVEVAQRVAELERLVRDARRRAHSERFAHDIKGASTTLASSVEVVLADQTRMRARVVAVSQGKDLALLKLDGHRTPFLTLGPEVRLATGQSVFAYGYPDDDAQGATSGLVIGVGPQELVTNVQLIPGHSGGPLLEASGLVVGVNAVKRVNGAQGVHARGQGIAIPIALALREFPQLRTGATRPAIRR